MTKTDESIVYLELDRNRHYQVHFERPIAQNLATVW